MKSIFLLSKQCFCFVFVTATLVYTSPGIAQEAWRTAPVNDLVLRIERLEAQARQQNGDPAVRAAIKELANRLNRSEQVIVDLRRQIAVSNAADSSNTGVDILSTRLDQIERDMRQLTGMLEQLQFDQDQVASSVETFSTRLGDLEVTAYDAEQGQDVTQVGLEELGSRLAALEAGSGGINAATDDILARLNELERKAGFPPPVPVELDEIAARLTALEQTVIEDAGGQAGIPPAQFNGLMQRLAELERQANLPPPVPVELQELSTRLTALERRGPAPAVDLSQINQRLAALESRSAVGSASPAYSPPSSFNSPPSSFTAPVAPQPQNFVMMDQAPVLPDLPRGRAIPNVVSTAPAQPSYVERLQSNRPIGELDGTPLVINPGQGTPPQAIGTISSSGGGGAIDAQSEYQAAVRLMEIGSTGEALDKFKAIVDALPSDPVAGASHYWIGEAEFGRGDYAAAAKAFLSSFRDFPDGAKAPGSLLRLGMTLSALGRTNEACEAFALLPIRYGAAGNDVLSRAAVESERNQCGL